MDNSRRQFLAGSLGAMAALSVGRAADDKRRFSQFDPHARHLVSEMSVDEKIGQMTQPDQMYIANVDDVEKYHVGSVLSGGDSDPKSGNDLFSWTDVYDRFQSRALKSKNRIPLLYGVDALHGHNNVIGAVIFPHNIGLGCSRNAALVEQAARITAEEVRATGMNWTFAPCVAVPQDIRWGRTYEGYSENPDIVKVLGAAATRGLQGSSLDQPLAVLACAKHYVGDGGTTFGTGLPRGGPQRFGLDQGDVRVDEATLRKIHLQGYITAIEMGVGTIMPSYSGWNGVKCSASQRLLTGILKQELGFDGFLISDYNALDELPGTRKEQIAQSINAGMDMVMVPERYAEYFNTLKELVQEGTVPMSRIDDAAVRIMRVKFKMGLMNPDRSLLADRTLHKSFGSAEHRRVARQCVRETLVLLKNEKSALPLKKSGRIHVAGKTADNIGNQCGGWTIFWQGKSGETTYGTTILDAIRGAAPGAQVSYSLDGSGADGASIGIAVIGETPYAEMQGDRTDLHLAGDDVAVVERLKSAGIPVVVVLVSGRPMLIDAILDRADAIVAAWLPGSEGDGVADALFGDSKFTGKLSFTWPRGDSSSFERSDPGYKTLFPLGFGLS